MSDPLLAKCCILPQGMEENVIIHFLSSTYKMCCKLQSLLLYAKFFQFPE